MNDNRDDHETDGARRDEAPSGDTASSPAAQDTTALPHAWTAAPSPGETAWSGSSAPGADQPTWRHDEQIWSASTGWRDEPQVWSAATTAPAAAPSRGVRTGTLILGLVLALAGFGALVTGLGYRLDLQLSVIVVLVVAAVALLLVPLLQRRRAERDDETLA